MIVGQVQHYCHLESEEGNQEYKQKGQRVTIKGALQE